MDKKYVDECTKDWTLLDTENGFGLYGYFDKVEWQYRLAIDDKNGNVIYTFDDRQHGNNYEFFNAVAKILGRQI